MLDEMESELNASFRQKIREDSIEVAYGKMVVEFCYRLLDGYTYEWVLQLLRSRWRKTNPVETDVC